MMNTEEESLRRQLISAYEIVLQPTSSIKERKDAEAVKFVFINNVILIFW